MDYCPNCGERNCMYEVEDGHKCALCGHKHTRKTGIVDQRPTKPHDAVCGEIVTNHPNGDKTYPKFVEGMCNDDSHCSFDSTSVVEMEDGTYLSVCTTHAKQFR